MPDVDIVTLLFAIPHSNIYFVNNILNFMTAYFKDSIIHPSTYTQHTHTHTSHNKAQVKNGVLYRFVIGSIIDSE